MHDPRLPPLVAPGPLRIPTKLDPVTRRRGQAPSGPQGLAAFLARPGLREALLATGSALLAQSDSPGTLGGALGRALPMGAQALQRGRQEAEIDALIEGAPPEMQQLLRALPASERVPALLGLQRGPDPVKLGAGERLVDPESGEDVVSALPQSDDYEYRQVGNTIAVFQNGQFVDGFEFDGPPEERFKDANTLRTQFEDQVSRFDEAVEAFRKVEAAGSKAEPTPADEIALVFGFMKTVDPTSAVREGEFATAQNAAGVPTRARNLYNQVLSGERLSPQQRAEFVAAARDQIESQRSLFDARADFYRGIAEREGLNPEDIIRDPFKGVTLSGPPEVAAPVAADAPDPLGLRGSG